MSRDKKPKDSDNSGDWKFDRSEEASSLISVVEPRKDVDPVHWATSEYMHNDKSMSWYLVLTLVTLILAGLVYLLTHDKITTGVVIFAGFIFGFYSGRRPHNIKYAMDEAGVTIGTKLYEYNSFKSFSLVNEGRFINILFVPAKRFYPMLSVYIDPKDEKKITDILDNRLPMDNRGQDFLERFLRRIGY